MKGIVGGGGCEIVKGMELTTHIGVRTRARTRTLAMEAAAKKRKIDSRELQLSSSSSSSSCRRLRRRLTSENFGSSVSIPVSRLSSNGSSSELVNETRSGVDLERQGGVVNESSTCSNCRKRSRENTPSSSLRKEQGSDDLKSMEKPSVSQQRSTDHKISPSEAELEEFFSVAEKEEQRRFSERYNYDIVKDVPLKGCYEWVPLKT